MTAVLPTISFAWSILTIPSWNLHDVEEGTVETAHLQPFEAGFADWTAVGEIRASSTGYLAVEGAGRPATALRVRGSAGGTLPPGMQIWIVRLR